MRNDSMQRHMREQHGVVEEKYTCREVGNEDRGKYKMRVLKGKNNACPVEGCSGGGKDNYGLYRHFCLKHPLADIVITGDEQAEKCELCGMKARNMGRHRNSVTCRKGQERRSFERRQDEQKEAEGVEIKMNGITIERVREFKYLGRILTEDDNDTPCIEDRLKKARRQWNCVAKILKQEGADAKTMAKFYIAVVQAVLLYGADSWVVKKGDMNRLRSFHLRAVRYMTGVHIRKEGEEWSYPDHEVLLEKCGLLPINVYVERRRGTLREYLEKNRKEVIEMAEGCGNHCRDPNKLLWWKQKYVSKTMMKDLKILLSK